VVEKPAAPSQPPADATPDDNQPDFYAIKSAAMGGSARAQYALGGLYEHGQGVTQDDEKAAKWYGIAAKQGYPNAQAAYDALMKKSP
jgi:TPR repeat protein